MERLKTLKESYMPNNQTRTVYAEKIFQLAKDKTDEVFYNSSSEHAIIVHQALVQNAESYVYIFSSSMCSEVSNNTEYVEIVKNFLSNNQNHNIKIILTDYSEDFPKSPIAEVLAKHSKQVEIKKYDGKVMYNGNPVHFTISDDRAFRLETNIEKRMAFGNFNSPHQAKGLKEIFNTIFSSSDAEPIRLNNVCVC